MRTVLIISGLDPTAGAGFLADARVAAEHGVRAVGVVTANTVQDTSGVRAVEPVAPEQVSDMLDALLADVEVDAVKIGMLGHQQTAEVVARALAATRAPVVWDPVIMPSRGGVFLLQGDPGRAVRALLPEVRLITPNLTEAALLTGCDVLDEVAMRRAAEVLCAAGAPAALVKGGHLPGAPTDILLDGGLVTVFSGERVDAGPLHGTGCYLSTAIACGLANGVALEDAVRLAKASLALKLAAPLAVGRGARCLV